MSGAEDATAVLHDAVGDVVRLLRHAADVNAAEGRAELAEHHRTRALLLETGL